MIMAGDGDDTIALNDWFGNNMITGGEGSETAGDTLDLSGTTTGVTFDLTDANIGTGTVSDGTNTARFNQIETVVLGDGMDTIVLADGTGADEVHAFNMTDSGDGTTTASLMFAA